MEKKTHDMLTTFERLNTEAAEINGKIREDFPFLLNTTNEMLETVLTELKEMKETVNKMEIELGNQKETLASLQRNVDTLNCQPDIKRKIFGKWKCITDEDYFSAKFEDDHFFMKRNGWRSFNEYTLGVKNQYGRIITVENNKLVQRDYSNNEEETRRDVFHFENERIIQVCDWRGKTISTWTYERVGDPQF